ncbi:MAG: PHP domain-containing protein, partial [Dehalococcoidales bacterium]|nr:PHP domain-containing protein [Dehalococcoidales bacterium]
MNAINDTDFLKVDLHIHTPQSVCYSDKSVTPDQIVAAALSSGLDAIAVTDHNTFESVDNIRCIAEGKGLSVFPGVELSTKSGHFLALFDIETTIAKLRQTLDSIGIARDGWGDAVMTIAGEAEEVFRRVNEA